VEGVRFGSQVGFMKEFSSCHGSGRPCTAQHFGGCNTGAPCPAGPLPTSPKHLYAAPVRNARAINLLECRTSIILLLVSPGSSV